jgi:hypothetical protein
MSRKKTTAVTALESLLSHDAEVLQGDGYDSPGLLTKDEHLALIALLAALTQPPQHWA